MGRDQGTEEGDEEGDHVYHGGKSGHTQLSFQISVCQGALSFLAV